MSQVIINKYTKKKHLQHPIETRSRGDALLQLYLLKKEKNTYNANKKRTTQKIFAKQNEQHDWCLLLNRRCKTVQLTL